MRIFGHDVSLQQFEKLLLSGEMVQRGAAKYSSTAQVTHVSLRDAQGHIVTPLQPPTYLNPGEELHRTLACEKPGQYAKFGLDRFMHDEYCHKKADGSLHVRDILSFHDGASTAQRGYVATSTGGGMQREAEPWKVNMAGMTGDQAPMRPLVEAGMRQTLPKTEVEMQKILEEESRILRDAA
jgi:hypothetical protein